jgi:hypothetical protein
VDTAYLYFDALHRDGLMGLLDMYQQKPPYSVTVLLTGFPFFFVAGNTQALFTSQVLYLFLMNISLLLLVRRLTGAMRWGAFSVIALNFWTSGIISHINANAAMEIVRYQLNVPISALFIGLIWCIIEGLYTRRYVLWCASLAVLFTSCLLLRGPMLPFYLAAFGPPLMLLGVGALYHRHRSLFSWLAVALMITGIFVGIHYINVWSKLMAYVERAAFSPHGEIMFGQLGSRWDRLWYYMERSLQISWLFPVFLAATFIQLPKNILQIKTNLEQYGKSWQSFRTIFIHFFLWWVTIVAVAVPTAAPIKNPYFGMSFMLAVWVLGIKALHELYYTQFNGHNQADAGFGHRFIQVFGAAVIALTFVVFARDIDWAVGFSESAAQGHSKRLQVHSIRKDINERIIQYIVNWNHTRGHKRISVDVLNPELFNYMDIHNLRIGMRMIAPQRVELFKGTRPMIGVEFDCNLSEPLVAKAINYNELLAELAINNTRHSFADKSFYKIGRVNVDKACNLIFYESDHSDYVFEYEWP